MGREEKLWFDLKYMPREQQSGKTLRSLWSQSWQQSPRFPHRAIKGSLCHQLASALTPATPKMAKE